MAPPPPPPDATQFMNVQSVAAYEDAFLQSTAPPSLAELQEVNEQRVRMRVMASVLTEIAPPLSEVVLHSVNVQSVKEDEEEIDWCELNVRDVISSFRVDSERVQ